jgi:hypothetical protein
MKLVAHFKEATDPKIKTYSAQYDFAHVTTSKGLYRCNNELEIDAPENTYIVRLKNGKYIIGEIENVSSSLKQRATQTKSF